MSNVTDFNKFKKQQLKNRNKAKTFCKSGFHKWQIIHKEQFDVKKGQLVTTYQCEHCQKIKSTVL